MINGREIVFKALVGSHNYNLNTPESDEDYKYFVFPTFDDLYMNRFYHTQKISEDVDYEVHDIRRLAELFMKSNPNYLEVLFSTKYEWGDSPLEAYLMHRRDRIARMNIPRLWSSIFGLGKEKEKMITKGTSSTQHLVDKFGYDTKQAMHAFRAHQFIIRLGKMDFDFGKAIWLEDDWRAEYLKIKRGHYSLDAMRSQIAIMEHESKGWEKAFKAQPVDTDMEFELSNMVRLMVARHIGKEILEKEPRMRLNSEDCENLVNRSKGNG